MLTTVAGLLRERTAEVHDRLETARRRPDRELRAGRVAAEALHCFTALAEWTAPPARAAAA